MSTYIRKMALKKNLPMTDGKKDINVEVIESDITQAKVRSSRECAFQRAAVRYLKRTGVKHAYFFRTIAWLEYADRFERYILPGSVQKEIVSFDRAGVMAPGIYHLTAPGKSSTLTAALVRSKKRPGRHKPTQKGPPRGIIHRTQFVRGVLDPDVVSALGMET